MGSTSNGMCVLGEVKGINEQNGRNGTLFTTVINEES